MKNFRINLRSCGGLVNFVAYMDRMQAKARARFAFSEFLGGSGKRCTPERLLVLDAVMEQRLPFTADTLLEHCKSLPGINICRATLFNTLHLLVQGGFVRRLNLEGAATYETLRKGAAKPAAYLVCSACGKTRRIDAPELSHWAGSLAPRGFTIDPATTVAYLSGLCSQCRRATK